MVATTDISDWYRNVLSANDADEISVYACDICREIRPHGDFREDGCLHKICSQCISSLLSKSNVNAFGLSRAVHRIHESVGFPHNRLVYLRCLRSYILSVYPVLPTTASGFERFVSSIQKNMSQSSCLRMNSEDSETGEWRKNVEELRYVEMLLALFVLDVFSR